MTARAIVPRVPDDGSVHSDVRKSVNIMRGVVNSLTKQSKIRRTAGNNEWTLGITTDDLPDEVIIESELDAALLTVTHPIFDHFATASSSHTDGTEDDLYSDTLAASQLLNNGQAVTADYGGKLVGHATATRRVKLYFGGTAIFNSGAILISADAAWRLQTLIIRVSATVIRHLTTFFCEAAPQAMYSTVGELTGLTLANTQVLKVIGAATGAGAASADIVAYLGKVIWSPVAS